MPQPRKLLGLSEQVCKHLRQYPACKQDINILQVPYSNIADRSNLLSSAAKQHSPDFSV
jgi:hypothetical protein